MKYDKRGMESTQRIIIVLLLLAIVFSAASIFISLTAFSGIDFPGRVSGQATARQGGGVNLNVEASNEGIQNNG